jgi:hypothetical protein
MKTSLLVIAPVVLVLAILSLIGAVAVPLSQGQVSFYQTPTYSGTAAVIGDFNLDGKLHHQLGRNGFVGKRRRRFYHGGHS